MINIPIEHQRHWTRPLPYDDLDAPYGDISPFVVLNEDIQQWLASNQLYPSVKQTKVAHASKKFQVTRIVLEFEDPESAVLFKLTWC